MFLVCATSGLFFIIILGEKKIFRGGNRAARFVYGHLLHIFNSKKAFPFTQRHSVYVRFTTNIWYGKNDPFLTGTVCFQSLFILF